MSRIRLETLRQTWRRMPAPLQWLAGGVLLLAAILAGGAITAYGGTLLVVLLWALCMGGLLVLLGLAWKLNFPEQTPLQDRRFICSFAAGALVGLGVIAALVFYRQTVYAEDAINYYAKQTLLFGSFSTSGFYGVHVLAENLLTADYKMFMNLFTSVPYLFTNRSINAFMICYALTCFVPMWFALLMVAKKIRGWFPGGHTGGYYLACMAAMVLWPMFLWPATHGMPDAFGLCFVAVILLLCSDFRFTTMPLARLAGLFAATFALILTRRWYMFWIVAFYLFYTLATLAAAARQKRLGRVLRNLLAFGLPSMVCILVVLLPTFRTILTTDYADIYGSYYGGGFWNNCLGQLRTQGIVWLLLCLAGLAAALRRQKARWPMLVVAVSSLVAMVLFTRTQSLGDHQSLILAPAYLGMLFCLLAWFSSLARTTWTHAGVGAISVFFLVNCANALRVPGKTVETLLLSAESLDLTRRADLDQMRAVTDFVLDNCTTEETVYINMDSDGYSGSTFAFSDPAHTELQSMILWENSVPSTHGFPTGIWSSKYVMVTDKLEEGGLVGGVNTALRTETPASSHYSYVTEFPLQNGITLYCYQRISPPDETEADYFKALFAEYDARWPELYSQRIDAYLAGL